MIIDVRVALNPSPAQITKLVGALVEHYKKQRRHQRQQQAATAAAEGRGPG
jgi:hypothetical protein